MTIKTIKKAAIDELNDEINIAINAAVANFVKKTDCDVINLDIAELVLHPDYNGRFVLSLAADFHLLKLI